ncbi:MAG: tetratricopeptide repeat protein [Candidatus Kapaibacterium sp.]
MKQLFLSVLGICLTAGSLLAQPMTDHDFQKQNTLARVYEETRDLPSAIRVFSELHKARPGASDVSESLFRCLYALKRYAEADTLMLERLNNEPQTYDLYVNLARVRTKLNRKSEALEAFNHALKFAKDDIYYSVSVMVAQAMMEIGYQEEALAVLVKQREGFIQPERFTDQIGGLYFKLGKYEEGVKEYLGMLHTNPQDISLIEQRIAQFTADSSVRRSIIRIITLHLKVEEASGPELRLLAWSYGELKNYKEAFQIYLKLDDMDIGSSSASAGGYELYQFANRILSEGALDIAVLAYDEAIKRFQNGAAKDPQRRRFVAMAELGALMTKEAYLRKYTEPPHDSLVRLVSDYRDFTQNQPDPDLTSDALLHAGELSFKLLRDFPQSQVIYENILARSQSYSEKTRDAYFALEEIALAEGDLPTALLRLDVLSDVVARRNRPPDAETKKHILFERGRIDFYNGAFDSCLATLDSIIIDPNSDYANDAIGLHSLISENEGNDAALKLFAKAELSSLGKDMNAALSAYRSIPETYPTATIADESILRAVELEVLLKKPNDALALLTTMQEKMMTSPLLDKAAFREAEITEVIVKDKAKAQRLYEDFLERYPKSPYSAEARKRARTLRGDSF